jgi:predicted SprT family Zn-dependent metalloprotease
MASSSNTIHCYMLVSNENEYTCSQCDKKLYGKQRIIIVDYDNKYYCDKCLNVLKNKLGKRKFYMH